MEQSESIAALAKALVAFQKTLKPIPKNSTVKIKTKAGGEYKYKYTDKATILNIILPLMTKEGLSLQQCMGVSGEKVGIYTQINHESGEWQRIFSPINPNMEDVKDIGSWNTYISRYALSFVGVVTDENDPDAQDATQAKEDAKGGKKAPAKSNKADTGDPGTPGGISEGKKKALFAIVLNYLTDPPADEGGQPIHDPYTEKEALKLAGAYRNHVLKMDGIDDSKVSDALDRMSKDGDYKHLNKWLNTR